MSFGKDMVNFEPQVDQSMSQELHLFCPLKIKEPTCSPGPLKVAGFASRWLFMAPTPSGRSFKNQGCCHTPPKGILALGSATSNLDNRSLHSGETFALGGRLYSTFRILCKPG